MKRAKKRRFEKEPAFWTILKKAEVKVDDISHWIDWIDDAMAELGDQIFDTIDNINERAMKRTNEKS